MSDAVELTVAGRVYGGWKSIDIQFDLDAAAAAFTLAVTERWPGQADAWAIEAGSAARVSIGGETVISGYVDRLDSMLEGEGHSISVSGRSRAADLIDCSAIAKPGSWSGRKLEEIAAELARPFGIAVSAKASTGAAFRKFALQPGESVWEAIARMCQFRGLLAVSTAEGDIEIIASAPAAPAVRIVQGEHPYAVAGSHDVTDRFSTYVIKGQAAGDDDINGKAAAGPKAEASDPAVKRHRPLLIVAEDQADIASLRKRAAWEATVRAAKAQQATITMPTWRQPGGALWMPRQMIALDAPAAWMTADLLVAGVSYIVDDRGRRVELRVLRPEAYSQLAVPEKAEASRVRKS